MKYQLLLIAVLACYLSPSKAQTYQVEEVSYEFSMVPVPGVNSKYDEFSPVWINNELIFTSGRESNLVLQGENNWGKQGFLNVFKSDFNFSDSAAAKGEKVQLYSKQIANNNHTGPVAFTSTGDTIFFTQLTERTKRQKDQRKPQLYMAVNVKGKWQNIQLLPFNNREYSFGHPAWDSKNQTLYFSSDMPNGKGGKDIYSVALLNGSWTQPKNIEVNSDQDEMFPFIIGNDLFFSSNREGGKGNLDIYWKQLGTPEKIQNLDALNTADDDHGLFILPNLKNGFMSKRVNGNDDIFMLNVERKVRYTNELAGKFTYRNLGTDASGLTLKLMHDNEVMFEITADENGEFQFRDLPHENYTIVTESGDNVELTLFDQDGNQLTELIQDGEGKFQYKKLSMDETNGTLSLLEEMNEGDLEITNRDLSGQIAFENTPGKYGDSVKVMLVNEDGEVVLEQYTDRRGNFTFKNIPIDQNLIIQTEATEDDVFLAIYDNEGDVVGQYKQNEKSQFIYKKIDPNYANNLQKLAVEEDVFEHNTATITGNFNYKKIEGNFDNGLTIYIYSDDGILLDSTTTNEYGEFNFRGLDPDESYLFKMKESELDLIVDDFNLHIEDRFGNVLADLYRAKDGFYKFKQFETEKENILSTIQENEQEFTLNEVKNEVKSNGLNIYFERNSSYTNFSRIEELQKLIARLKQNSSLKVTINAYASCIASDAYNQWLSERRGNRVRDYLIAKGINPNRIQVQAFGESKVQNNCDEGSVSDEEHAKNRKVEIVVQS